MSMDRTGQVIGERYRIERQIGEGGMQLVYKARDLLLNKDVALKTPKDRSATKRFRRSAIVAAKVNHHNVAKTLDYVKEGENRYLIEELIIGDDLQNALMRKAKFVEPYSAAKLFNQLSKGLAAAHHAGVIHRDLKPTNVMISGGYSLKEVKITDFGIAKMADEELTDAAKGGESTLTTSKTAIGALPYMAPEAIEAPEEVGPPADVWSIGAMFYHILTGEFPFGAGLKAVNRIINVDLLPPPKFLTNNPQFAPLASELLEIAKSCLQKDPSARPTADQLVARCGLLCYAISERFEGSIRDIRFNAWGFIQHNLNDVFFHKSSVYGPNPAKVGASVGFAKYHGGGAWRAHPVIVFD